MLSRSTQVKNKVIQLLVVEGGLPFQKALVASHELFILIDSLCDETEVGEKDTKSGNLFDNPRVGRKCKYCGTYYSNLLQLEEHEDICKSNKGRVWQD